MYRLDLEPLLGPDIASDPPEGSTGIKQTHLNLWIIYTCSSLSGHLRTRVVITQLSEQGFISHSVRSQRALPPAQGLLTTLMVSLDDQTLPSLRVLFLLLPPNSRLYFRFSGPPSAAAEGTQEHSQRVFLAQDVVWEPALGLSSGLSLHPQALPCVYRISF